MRHEASDLFLRLGTALALLFPAIDAFLNPYSWVAYVPQLFGGIVPDMVMLHTFGIIEIVLGVWILSGRRIFWPSVAATVLILLVVLFNLGDFEVLYRDLAIAAMTFALAIAHRPHRHTA